MNISKEFQWDMAHHLPGHIGLCKNVHGHTYKMRVTISGDLIKQDSSAGMVIDFKNFKDIVNKNIVEKFDHAFVADSTNDESIKVGKFLEDIGNKVVWLPYRSTAENMAEDIFKELYNHMAVEIIELWETPTSCAIYTVRDFNKALLKEKSKI